MSLLRRANNLKEVLILGGHTFIMGDENILQGGVTCFAN
jgi:hypothetical protein